MYSPPLITRLSQIRFGEVISMLYFNPWATGAAGAGLLPVGLPHRPVYLTSHGPSGKTSLLRLLLARTKLRQARGVAALLGPSEEEDADALAIPSGGTGAAASAAPPVPPPHGTPVNPTFLPHLTTHWMAMPRLISATDFQVCRERTGTQ